MDIVSHALWTNAIYLKARRRARWFAVAFALLPDIISFGPFFLEELAVHGIHEGPPTFKPVALAYISRVYPITHSMIIFAAVFIVVWAMRRRPYLPLAAWGLHIATDIFTHSRNFFPTPFLFPVSDYTVNAISWANPRFLIPNLAALAATYLLIFILRRRQRVA